MSDLQTVILTRTYIIVIDKALDLMPCGKTNVIDDKQPIDFKHRNLSIKDSDN